LTSKLCSKRQSNNNPVKNPPDNLKKEQSTMQMIESLIIEFEHEAQTTRKHLERLPNDKMGWRPHEKSATAGDLASHIVECVGWADSIFNLDEFDIDATTYKPYQASSVADLLKTFDDKVAKGRQALAGAADVALMQPWRFKVMGRVRFERIRAVVFRDFTLSHLIHHRGQFSLYLRLLNVPVPGSYGPTADEQA
jgi:uncharacterized damage-inducible protein DinB